MRYDVRRGIFGDPPARARSRLAGLWVTGAGLALWLDPRAGHASRANGARREAGRGARRPPTPAGISISAGVDWTSAYFFRGIKQETEDLILQPYGEISFKLVENAGALTSLSLTAGMWNSLQTGPSGSDSPTATDPKVWYELDGYGKLSAVLLGGPHSRHPLHGVSQPQQRLQLGPGGRVRVRLQRRQAPGPLRAQPELPGRLRVRRPGGRRRPAGRLRPDWHRARLHVPRRFRLPGHRSRCRSRWA